MPLFQEKGPTSSPEPTATKPRPPNLALCTHVPPEVLSAFAGSRALGMTENLVTAASVFENQHPPWLATSGYIINIFFFIFFCNGFFTAGARTNIFIVAGNSDIHKY